MRESRLYLRFLRENLFFVLIPGLLFLLAVFLYQRQLLTVYSPQALYEIQYTEGSVSEAVVLADQVVTSVRSENIKQSLGLDPSTEVMVFKPGPISLSVTVVGRDTDTSKGDLNKVAGYLKSKYPVSDVGEAVFLEVSRANHVDLFYALSIGSLLGLSVALVRSYFKNY